MVTQSHSWSVLVCLQITIVLCSTLRLRLFILPYKWLVWVLAGATVCSSPATHSFSSLGFAIQGWPGGDNDGDDDDDH